MITNDSNTNDLTLGELKDEFQKLITKDNTRMVLDFDKLSELGLVYLINNEVLHPLGIALVRSEGGISMGAALLTDGDKYEFSEETHQRHKQNLIELPKRIGNLIDAKDSYYGYEVGYPLGEGPKGRILHHIFENGETIKSSKATENTGKTGKTEFIAPTKKLTLLDSLNIENIFLGEHDIFMQVINEINIDTLQYSLNLNYPKHKDSTPLPRKIENLTDLVNTLIYIFDHYFDFITFEGIDATGKQTISNLFKEFLEQLTNIKKSLVSNAFCSNEGIGLRELIFPTNLHITKQNIPDYEIESGKAILETLHTNPDSNSLKYLFGINRFEVQNTYKTTAMQVNYGSIRIYDRYVESSMAFTTAKELIKADFNPVSLYDTERLSFEQLNPEHQEIVTKVYHEIDELEYYKLGLDKPKVIVLCYAPLSTISERLAERAKHTELDKHETNMKLLSTTQQVYHMLMNKIRNKQTNSSKNPITIKLNTLSLSPLESVNKLVQELLNFAAFELGK